MGNEMIGKSSIEEYFIILSIFYITFFITFYSAWVGLLVGRLLSIFVDGLEEDTL